MNSLRNMIALFVLASSTLSLAQNTPIKLMVSVAPGGPVDMTARNMGRNLQASSGRGYQVTNVVGEFGTRAVQAFRSAPADGNQLLILHATPGQPAPDVAGLVPIAIIVGESSRYRWVGVFAPPGTPAGIARELERAVLGALRSPDFGQTAGLSLSPGDGASLARLVGQSAGGADTPVSSLTMSQDQIAACFRTIASAFNESKSWPGNEIEVAARLGRIEVDLFEGRCAGHPSAEGYIKSGNLKLARAQNVTGDRSIASSDANTQADDPKVVGGRYRP